VRLFLQIWFGQLISFLGSGITNFALAVWVYKQTGSATHFSLFYLGTTLSALAVAPVAGVFIDRWGRRQAMLVSDFGSGLATLGLVLALSFGHLSLWQVYLASVVKSAFEALHWPAYTTVSTLLLPPRHFGRAYGLVNASEAIAQIGAPALAGILIETVNLSGTLLIDCASFLVGIALLLPAKLPRHAVETEDARAGRSFREDSIYGWKYMTARRGLMALLMLFTAGNFVRGMVTVLATPLVLSFGTSAELGLALSFVGGGFFCGSLVMSVWGGPQKRIRGIFLFQVLSGIALMLAGSRPSIYVVIIAAASYFIFQPVVYGTSQAIWQSKVSPDAQGRVFSMRRAIWAAALPIAYIAAGPLADHVFEPMLAEGALLSGSVGALIGVGQGRGIGFIYIIMGLFVVAQVGVAAMCRPLVMIESECPDAVVDPLASGAISTQ